jgi:plasmid stabilization system protein ParE
VPPVRVAALARRQADRAVAWYSEDAPEQVERLLASLDQAQRLISENPLVFRQAKPGLRRVALRSFPYHLWFVTDRRDIVIIAMTHFRQDTSYLAEGSSPGS